MKQNLTSEVKGPFKNEYMDQKLLAPEGRHIKQHFIVLLNLALLLVTISPTCLSDIGGLTELR